MLALSLDDGFLGTRAPLVPDLIIVALLVVVPAFAAATVLAVMGRTRLHHTIMWITYHVLLVVVVAFVIYNLTVHMSAPELEQSPVYRTIYLPLVVFHIAIASFSTAFGGWLAWATRRWARPSGGELSLEPSRARLHRRAGTAALALFAVTIATGLAIYYFRYIYIFVPA